MYIIVETRANYHRDIKTVIKLINHADEAGVGVVKFQTYKAEELYSKYAPKFFRDNVDLFDLIKENEVVRS